MRIEASIEALQRLSPKRRLAIVAPLALLAFAYLLYAGLKPSAPHADFNYFWLAGRLWGWGLDPYGPIFAVEGRKLNEDYPSIYWPYPPNWWPVAVLLAKLSLVRATQLWTAASLLFVLSSCELLRRSRAALHMSAPFDLTLLLLGYIGLSTATATVMMWGNCSILIMFGSALLALGLTSRNQAAAVIGLAIMALKPTIGLPVITAVTFSRGWGRTGVAAGVLVAVMALPALATSSPQEILTSLTQTARTYESITGNSAQNQPGVDHLASLLCGITISGGMSVVFAVLSAMVLTLLLRISTRDNPADAVPVLFAGLGSAGMFSLHGYDLPVLLPLLALASRQGAVVFAQVLVGFLFFFRPGGVVSAIELLGGSKLPGATLPTVGVTLIYAAAIFVCTRHVRSAATAERLRSSRANETFRSIGSVE
jgi:hypothetical protein